MKKIDFALLALFLLSACSLSSPQIPEGWTEVRDAANGVHFAYPESLSNEYTNLLTEVEFMPQFTWQEGVFNCESEEGVALETRILEGQAYCVQHEDSGAAGSLYRTYHYAREENDKVLKLTFTLRQVQCGNYDEVKKAVCEEDQGNFNPDNLATGIFGTVGY